MIVFAWPDDLNVAKALKNTTKLIFIDGMAGSGIYQSSKDSTLHANFNKDINRAEWRRVRYSHN